MAPEHVQAGRWALTLTHDQATGLYLATGTEDGHVVRVRVLPPELADDAADRLTEEARRTEVYGGTFRWEDLLGE